MSELSHLDDAGRARMVDVGGKAVTDRRAVARAVVRMSAGTAAAVRIEVGYDRVAIEAEARTSAQTGVEMEAMTAASVAALTVYDMVKGLERGVEIAEVALVEKSGGRHDWRRSSV